MIENYRLIKTRYSKKTSDENETMEKTIRVFHLPEKGFTIVFAIFFRVLLTDFLLFPVNVVLVFD